MKMFILLLIIFYGVESRVNPYGPTIVSDFTNCVSELMDYNFNESGFLIFANTKNVSTSVARIREELLKKINYNLNFSVQIKSPTNVAPICESDIDNESLYVVHMEVYEAIRIADYFVIIIDNYRDFTFVASRIIHSRNWNPEAKFIILFFHFATNEKTNKRYIERMLTCLYKSNVINIVVIVPQVDSIRNAIVYSWRPLDPPKYCGYFNETAKDRLLVENICERGLVKQQKDIFGGRIPENMKGCTLQILALERQPFVSRDDDEPNIEKYYIDQLADLYGYKTEYQIITGSRGERNETGVWDGGLQKLTAKKGHILLGGIFPDFDVHEDFESSSTYLADSYTWVSPRAFKSPKWKSLFVIFQFTVWCCVVGVFFICVLSWKFFGYLSGESIYHKALGHCCLNTWISHVGFCAYARPVKDSLRVFYVFFNIYCILFLTGYQTKLFDVLTNISFEEQIDTIEELAESGLMFGGFEELHDLFFNSSDPFDYFLGEKWVDVDNMTTALIDVAKYRNFSVLCSRLELAYLSAVIPELSEISGDYKYYAFRENMFTVPMEMVALRGFPFMDHFSHMLERLKQAGVNSNVRRYFAESNSRKRAKLLRSLAGEDSDVSPLTMQHLQGGFLALALGVIGGTLTLIVELIVNSRFIKRKVLLCKKRLKRN